MVACTVTEGMVPHCGVPAEDVESEVDEEYWEFTESEADGIDVFEVDEEE